MSTRFWIYSGNRPSNSAKELSKQQSFLRLRDHRFHKVKPHDIVINWGVSSHFNVPCQTIFNEPENIKIAANKLETFQLLRMKDVECVEWTPKQSIAQYWCDEGSTIVVREKLTGHSGDGIIVIEKLGIVPAAPLYTKYIFKVKEFRVHVVCGNVVDIAQKIKDPKQPEVKSWKVRSHANGFIFARNGVKPNEVRDMLALSAVHALGLDFGAVDIIEDKHGKFYVLEVNTAPGLEGQTVKNYAEAFRASQG